MFSLETGQGLKENFIQTLRGPLFYVSFFFNILFLNNQFLWNPKHLIHSFDNILIYILSSFYNCWWLEDKSDTRYVVTTRIPPKSFTNLYQPEKTTVVKL